MSGKCRSDIQPPLAFRYEKQGAEEDYVGRPEWSKDPIRERTNRERRPGRRDNMQWRRRLGYRTSLDVSGTVTRTTADTDAQTPERSLTRQSSRRIRKGRFCAFAA
jgi:hypothetical protein